MPSPTVRVALLVAGPIFLGLLLEVPRLAGAAPAAAAGSASSSADAEPRLASSSGVAGADARQRALEHFERGSAAFAERRYKDAIELFLEADRIARSPAFSFNAALAYEQMGDASNALGSFREYLRRTPAAVDADEVGRSIARLERVLEAKGQQQVSILSLPDGATVMLDGRPVGVTPWTADLVPGNHKLRLQLDGHSPVETAFELRADRSMDVRLALDKLPEAPPPSASSSAASIGAPLRPAAQPTKPARVPMPSGSDEGSDGLAVGAATWVSLGIGVAALGSALGLELGRASAEDAATNAATQVEAGSEFERMQDLQLGGRILAVAGAAAMVVGGTLLVLDLSAAWNETVAAGQVARLGLGCQGGLCGARIEGRF
jgi:tetratricopeptide (TPR) repeat protein